MTDHLDAAAAGEMVIAVVVTHDRRALAVDAVRSVLQQSRRPDAVLVVDTASSDGTPDAVEGACPGAIVHRLRDNLGGAGGFAYGIAEALAMNADFVWLLDDDTVPQPDALAALLRVQQSSALPLTLIASRVVWSDGRDHPMNTPRAKPFATPAERRTARVAGGRPVRSASFVSVLVRCDAIRRCGLPVADYFLWNDDFEFTARVLRRRHGLWCPDSVVEHRTARFSAAMADPGERFGYEVRNKIWLLTRSTALGPLERALYAAITAARWTGLIVRSPMRRRLLVLLAAGVWAGVRRGPRPTADILRTAQTSRADNPL